MLNKIKGYFSGGYNIGIKIAIFVVTMLISGIITSKITNVVGLTDYEGHTKATGLWRASGAPTMKSLHDSYFDAYDVPDTHDTVANVNTIVSLLLSFFILITLNNRKKLQLNNDAGVKSDE